MTEPESPRVPLNIYFAYPIDNALTGESDYANTVNTIAGKLAVVADVLFMPGNAFTVRSGAMKSDYINIVNAVALEESTLVVAYLPSDVRSVGVPAEIERALGLGVPTLVMTDDEGWFVRSFRTDKSKVVRMTPDDANTPMYIVDSVASMVPAVRTYLREVTDRPERTPLAVHVGAGGTLPSQAHRGDAGLDLYVSEGVIMPPGSVADIKTSVSVDLPEGVWGLLTGRSSTLRKRGLTINTGIIDTGYRGELYVLARNHTDKTVHINPGERLAQFILLPNMTDLFEPQAVEKITESTRGTNGFGSTGI